MEGEISNFIKVWLQVIACISYCYLVANIVPKGKSRFMSFLPVVCLFLVLPLSLNSIHLGLATAFFIAWLANFKLLLLAFGMGPLSDSSLSLRSFLLLACLPIKIQQKTHSSVKLLKNSSSRPLNNGSNNGNPFPKPTKSCLKSSLNYGTKALLSVCLLLVHEYGNELCVHPMVLKFITCLYIYMGMEVILAGVAVVARAMIGTELEPQFDEPYLSASLREFWGRRWNLMSSDILRLSVHLPVLKLSRRVLGKKWAPIPAVLGTFLVSGLVHDLLFYYLSRVKPTWGTTVFFLLHGICVLAETYLKLFTPDWEFPRPISGTFVFGFVIITFASLILPYLLSFHVNVRAVEEYKAVLAFVIDFF